MSNQQEEPQSAGAGCIFWLVVILIWLFVTYPWLLIFPLVFVVLVIMGDHQEKALRRAPPQVLRYRTGVRRHFRQICRAMGLSVLPRDKRVLGDRVPLRAPDAVIDRCHIPLAIPGGAEEDVSDAVGGPAHRDHEAKSPAQGQPSQPQISRTTPPSALIGSI